jgi:uncharacterized protein YukE
MADAENSNITVPASLAGAGAELNQRAAKIAGDLAALMVQLEPLEPTWTGSAYTYYTGLQQEWNVAAAGLFGPDGVLGDIANRLNLVWANYSDAEWTSIGNWQH